jgi:nitrite reductase/ring-hydroxylating ferredoxin subunit
MGEYIRVVGVADIPPGSGRVAEVSGRSIAIFNDDGACFALDNPAPIEAARLKKVSSKEKSSPVLGTAGNTMSEQGSR